MRQRRVLAYVQRCQLIVDAYQGVQFDILAHIYRRDFLQGKREVFQGREVFDPGQGFDLRLRGSRCGNVDPRDLLYVLTVDRPSVPLRSFDPFRFQQFYDIRAEYFIRDRYSRLCHSFVSFPFRPVRYSRLYRQTVTAQCNGEDGFVTRLERYRLRGGKQVFLLSKADLYQLCPRSDLLRINDG